MRQTASQTTRRQKNVADERYMIMISPAVLAVLLAVLAFGLGLASGYVVWGRGGPSAITRAVSATTTAQSSGDSQVKRYEVPDDGDPAYGPQNAPVTIIEFSDYQCPYCQKWHNEVYKQLLESYPTQVRFVYRDFPLTSIHPEAEPAAEAANCAHEQGKFWEFHDLLFGGRVQLGNAAYNQYASQLGMDTAKFSECLSSGRYKEEVMADLNWASNLGVQSTPTFFVNGIPVIGAQPFSVFKQVIDKEIAGEYTK